MFSQSISCDVFFQVTVTQNWARYSAYFRPAQSQHLTPVFSDLSILYFFYSLNPHKYRSYYIVFNTEYKVNRILIRLSILINRINLSLLLLLYAAERLASVLLRTKNTCGAKINGEKKGRFRFYIKKKIHVGNNQLLLSFFLALPESLATPFCLEGRSECESLEVDGVGRG